MNASVWTAICLLAAVFAVVLCVLCLRRAWQGKKDWREKSRSAWELALFLLSCSLLIALRTGYAPTLDHVRDVLLTWICGLCSAMFLLTRVLLLIQAHPSELFREKVGSRLRTWTEKRQSSEGTEEAAEKAPPSWDSGDAEETAAASGEKAE